MLECVCVGRGCKEECGTQQPPSQLLGQREQHRLKVIVRVIQNTKTNFQYLIPLNYLTMLMSCEIQLYSTLTTNQTSNFSGGRGSVDSY